MKPLRKDKHPTSWEPVQKWYRDIVGDEGHYYHQQIILPGVMRLLDLKKESTLLDLGCGDGILARHVPKTLKYVGLDAAPSFIKAAKEANPSPHHHFDVADATKPLPIKDQQFTHSTVILALQNMENPEAVLKNLAKHLVTGGKLVIVMNHPCFRIPRQSSWQIDDQKKLQYRRIDRYFTPLDIPIQAHPGKGGASATTVSFHHPISSYSHWLKNSGMFIADMEEWCSDKVSTGGAAKMENRSRQEFPLFLAILAERR